MTSTPSSERLHITVFGKRNSGKSSLVNAITGQPTSLVSDIPGTTTDPVKKAMEIPGIGPCLFTDTAGFDDDAGRLGEKRIELTTKALENTDIALMIFTDCGTREQEWYRSLIQRKIPVIPLINKTDRYNGAATPQDSLQPATETISALAGKVESLCKEPPLLVNASNGQGIDSIPEAILRKLPEDFGHRSITGKLVKDGDAVLLVMPQDIQAPKGRLILPQVQTLRELLDRKCTTICCTTDRMKETLERLAAPPELIITDSQAFSEVWRLKPEQSRLTSFSILFAAYKGDIEVFMEGAKALEHLNGNSRILIAEACTHAPASEDIGRVKIPRMLRQRFGESLEISIVSGSDFPDDLSGYDLVIHCGACMFNRRYVLSRIASAQKQRIPITNYGITIAFLKGILHKIDLP